MPQLFFFVGMAIFSLSAISNDHRKSSHLESREVLPLESGQCLKPSLEDFPSFPVSLAPAKKDIDEGEIYYFAEDGVVVRAVCPNGSVPNRQNCRVHRTVVNMDELLKLVDDVYESEFEPIREELKKLHQEVLKNDSKMVELEERILAKRKQGEVTERALQAEQEKSDFHKSVESEKNKNVVSYESRLKALQESTAHNEVMKENLIDRTEKKILEAKRQALFASQSVAQAEAEILVLKNTQRYAKEQLETLLKEKEEFIKGFDSSSDPDYAKMKKRLDQTSLEAAKTCFWAVLHDPGVPATQDHLDPIQRGYFQVFQGVFQSIAAKDTVPRVRLPLEGFIKDVPEGVFYKKMPNFTYTTNVERMLANSSFFPKEGQKERSLFTDAKKLQNFESYIGRGVYKTTSSNFSPRYGNLRTDSTASLKNPGIPLVARRGSTGVHLPGRRQVRKVVLKWAEVEEEMPVVTLPRYTSYYEINQSKVFAATKDGDLFIIDPEVGRILNPATTNLVKEIGGIEHISKERIALSSPRGVYIVNYSAPEAPQIESVIPTAGTPIQMYGTKGALFVFERPFRSAKIKVNQDLTFEYKSGDEALRAYKIQD